MEGLFPIIPTMPRLLLSLLPQKFYLRSAVLVPEHHMIHDEEYVVASLSKRSAMVDTSFVLAAQAQKLHGNADIRRSLLRDVQLVSPSPHALRSRAWRTTSETSIAQHCRARRQGGSQSTAHIIHTENHSQAKRKSPRKPKP
eukprot:3026447-Amphidinium_carterae.1